MYSVPAAATPASNASAAAAQPPAANNTPPDPRFVSPASLAVSFCVTIVDKPVGEIKVCYVLLIQWLFDDAVYLIRDIIHFVINICMSIFNKQPKLMHSLI